MPISIYVSEGKSHEFPLLVFFTCSEIIPDCYIFFLKEDKALVKKMREANEAELAKLDAEIANAEKNEGESELRDKWQKKAEYLTKVRITRTRDEFSQSFVRIFFILLIMKRTCITWYYGGPCTK